MFVRSVIWPKLRDKKKPLSWISIVICLSDPQGLHFYKESYKYFKLQEKEKKIKYHLYNCNYVKKILNQFELWYFDLHFDLLRLRFYM